MQIAAPHDGRFDLASATQRLAAAGAIEQTAYFVRCRLADPPEISLTLFPDGRLMIQGTGDPAKARSIAAKYVGT